MILLAGLGNPGKNYHNTRHNIGFMALDIIHDNFNGSSWRNKFLSEVSEATINNQKTLFMKPQTYMNLSGNAINEAATFYKIPAENIFIIHDELDLQPGQLKIKQGGGDAGHNGLKSITSHIGANYHRYRLGIGHPGIKSMVSSYVLHPLPKDEVTALEENVKLIIDDFCKKIS